MQESLSSQLFVFFYSLVLGLALGAAYDFFRILRMLANPKNLSVFLQDIFYFLVSAVVTFLFVLGINGGNSRLYILVAEALGWICYHLTLGQLVCRCSEGVMKWIKTKLKTLKKSFSEKFSKKGENNQ